MSYRLDKCTIPTQGAILPRKALVYYVNVTDENGNKVSHLVVPEASNGSALHIGASLIVPVEGSQGFAKGAATTQVSTAQVTRWMIPGLPLIYAIVEAVAGIAVGVLSSISLLTVAGLAVLASTVVVASYAVIQNQGAFDRGRLQDGRFKSLPPSATVAEIQARGETYDLPAGRVYQQGDAIRGWGYAYILATTGLTISAIEGIVTYGSVVDGPGEEWFIIDRTLSEEELIILSIIGGTIVAADKLERPVEHDTSESNCNTEDFVVETENDRGPQGNPEHTLRDEKPINDKDTLDDILRNPDRILDFGNRRYLFRAFEDGKTAVIKLHRNLNPGFDTVYELITQLTDGGNLYDSLDDAVDDIKNNEDDGREPTKDIDC